MALLYSMISISLLYYIQTVTGNIALCCKLSEADIRLVYQAANSGIEYNEYYVTLEAIIKVSEQIQK